MAEVYNMVARVRRDDLAGADIRVSSAYQGRELQITFQDESPANVARAIDAMIRALVVARRAVKS